MAHLSGCPRYCPLNRLSDFCCWEFAPCYPPAVFPAFRYSRCRRKKGEKPIYYQRQLSLKTDFADRPDQVKIFRSLSKERFFSIRRHRWYSVKRLYESKPRESVLNDCRHNKSFRIFHFLADEIRQWFINYFHQNKLF